jgi:hypothetical protein
MRIWTAAKILSAIFVTIIVALSYYFTLHVIGKKVPRPFATFFSRYMPEPAPLIAEPMTGNDEHLKMLEAGEMNDIEPGDRAFQVASELLATGKTAVAREKLLFLINYYPACNSSAAARHILGEMNMDDFLAVPNNPNVISYKVARGDSYLGICAKHHTSLDCIMHFNGFLELRALQPGDEINLLPLDLRLTIEPSRKAITITRKNIFLKEYPILRAVSPPSATLTTKIESKGGIIGTRKITPTMKDYRGSQKTITLGKGFFILAHDPHNESPARGFHIDTADTEELALILRVGNDVEIRP